MTKTREKKNAYVVWEGHQTGVFLTWAETEQHTKKFKGAKFKGFATVEEAHAAFAQGYDAYMEDQKNAIPVLSDDFIIQEITNGNEPYHEVSISCDGAASGTTNMQYQFVWTQTKMPIYTSPVFPQGTNNIAEFLALAHAIKYMYENAPNTPIYSDSRTAIAWVKNKKVNTSHACTPDIEMRVQNALAYLQTIDIPEIRKWETKEWGENPADFGNK